MLLCLLAAGAAACAPLLTELAVPMSVEVGQGPGGLIAEGDPSGPDLWLGDRTSTRLLSTDATGDRAVITDGDRIALWDGRRARLEQLLPPSGRGVQRAVLSRGGGHILAVEQESSRTPQLQWLRVLDVARGRTLLSLAMPCGCIVDVAFGERSGTIRALLSSAELGGTWVLSWSMEGAFESQHHVTDEVLERWQGGAYFHDDGEQAMIFVRDDGGEDVVHLGELGRGEGGWRRLLLGSPFDGDPKQDTGWRCGRVATVTPDGAGLLLATGSPGRTTRIERLDLETGELVWIARRRSVNPVMWSPWRDGAVQLIVHGVDARGFSSPMEGMVVDPDTGELAAEPPPEDLPVPPLLRVVPWAEVDTAGPFRAALGLPDGLDDRLWVGRSPQMFIDRATGVRHIVTLDGYFRLDATATRMPSLHAVSPKAVFEGRWNLENPHLRAVVTSFEIELENIRTQAPWSTALPGPRVAWGWSVPTGLIADAQPLPSGDLVVQGDSAGSTVRLYVIRPPVTPSEGWLAMRSFQAAPGVERYAMTTTPDGARLLMVGLAHGRDDAPATLDVSAWDTEQLSLRDRQRVELGPSVTHLATVPGLDRAAAWARHRVHLVSLPDGRVRSWTPRATDWIKGAIPLGADLLAVRLALAERPSGEWWLVLDLATDPPHVLGERRFTDVVAHAVWPEGRTLDLLDRRGVITRLSLEHGLPVLECSLLSTTESTFLTIDRDGQLRLPEDPAGFAQATAWLRGGHVMPVVLDQTGRVQLNTGHYIRGGASAPRW